MTASCLPSLSFYHFYNTKYMLEPNFIRKCRDFHTRISLVMLKWRFAKGGGGEVRVLCFTLCTNSPQMPPSLYLPEFFQTFSLQPGSNISYEPGWGWMGNDLKEEFAGNNQQMPKGFSTPPSYAQSMDDPPLSIILKIQVRESGHLFVKFMSSFTLRCNTVI